MRNSKGTMEGITERLEDLELVNKYSSWEIRIYCEFGLGAPILERQMESSYLRLIARRLWQRIIHHESQYQAHPLYEEYNDIRYAISISKFGESTPRVYYFLLTKDLERLILDKAYRAITKLFLWETPGYGDAIYFYEPYKLNPKYSLFFEFEWTAHKDSIFKIINNSRFADIVYDKSL